jgi:hypothetical protein
MYSCLRDSVADARNIVRLRGDRHEVSATRFCERAWKWKGEKNFVGECGVRYRVFGLIEALLCLRYVFNVNGGRSNVRSKEDAMAADHSDEALFTKVTHVDEDNDLADDALRGLGAIVIFGAFLVFVLVKWKSVALDSSSFAGGRTASMRRLLGRIGQVPVAAVLGVLVLISIYAFVSSLRKLRILRKQTNA